MACWNRVTARIVDGLPQQPGQEPLLRAQGAARLLPRRPAQLAGVRRREDQQRQPAREQPVLGQHDAERRARSSARRTGPTPNTPAQPAHLSLTCTPDDPTRPHPAGVLRARARRAARHELPGLRGRDRRRHRPHREHGRAATSSPSATSTRSWSTAGTTATPTSSARRSTRRSTGRSPSSRRCWGASRTRTSSIANSDSGAFAYTHSAINEAYRAVQDLPG